MFTKIGIIGGSGQMGATFTPRFRELGIEVIIASRQDPTSEKRVALECEMIIISVPIDETVKIIRRIKPWLRPHQLLSDFTSVKNKVVPEMMETEAEVISCHPMFGKMNDIKGQNIILLPIHEGKFFAKTKRLFKMLGLNVVVMNDWKKHDEAMSVIQGLMHFQHIVFTQTLAARDIDLETILSICSPVYQANFAFACRIIQRDPHLYTHILMDNPENLNVLKDFIHIAQESIKMIKNKDEEQFKQKFNQSKEFLGDYAQTFGKQSEFLVEQLNNYSQKNPES